MKIRIRLLVILITALAVFAAFGVMISGYGFDVLQPAGSIAAEQKNIFIFAALLSLIVVVPVFALAAYIVWNFRETHAHAPRFDPTFESSPKAEFIWWSVPFVLIAILGVVIWISSHRLDPYKPLVSDSPPLNVQVIALNWKWLFIYPDQKIASVNHLQVPTGRPINFVLTSDAPMTSFWIPKLGGQIYAMSGMTTKLHLQANETGTFTGRNANISGEGYSGMTFSVRADSEAAFKEWVQQARQTDAALDTSMYETLAKPSKDEPQKQYRLASDTIFDGVIMKYMSPTRLDDTTHESHASHMQGHN